MKKIFSFMILAFITISCSNTEDPATPIDPTKLAKVIFYPNTLSERHWNFYPNGLLKEIIKPDGTILQSFVYDRNNNLLSSTVFNSNTSLNVSYNFTYDNNNHIDSYNGKVVTYNPTENSYTVHNNYTITNPSHYDEIDSWEITLNNELLITSEKINYLTSEGNWYEYGVAVAYENNNMVHNTNGIDPTEGNYQFDNKINPFKQPLLPICRAMSITNFNDQTTKWAVGEYNSVNNVTHDGYDNNGQEEVNYSYQYNTNNLPINQNSGYILYYYQGNIIP